MARTESSLDRRSVTAAISDHMARLIALRIFGRLNTTVAIGPSCSTRMWSLMSSLPWGCRTAERGGRAESGSRGTSLAEALTDFNRPAAYLAMTYLVRYDAVMNSTSRPSDP